MILHEVRDWLTFFIEAGILWILIIEYHYDKHFNERLKARRDKRRNKYDFEILTDGEGK